jgi:hypothetical protein
MFDDQRKYSPLTPSLAMHIPQGTDLEANEEQAQAPFADEQFLSDEEISPLDSREASPDEDDDLAPILLFEQLSLADSRSTTVCATSKDEVDSDSPVRVNSSVDI